MGQARRITLLAIAALLLMACTALNRETGIAARQNRVIDLIGECNAGQQVACDTLPAAVRELDELLEPKG